MVECLCLGSLLFSLEVCAEPVKDIMLVDRMRENDQRARGELRMVLCAVPTKEIVHVDKVWKAVQRAGDVLRLVAFLQGL